MPAAPDTAAITNQPEPVPGPATVASDGPAKACANRVLGLLRKLIDYGQELARTLQQRAAAGTLLTVALQFGTRDIALILARITRGLRLASALEARLVSRPVRPDADPAPVCAPADGAKRMARRTGPRPSLPDIPTAEEIAAALRHRPAGAVIADICRDLGIVPAHPLWQEVMTVLSLHGGNFMALLNDVMVRLFPCLDQGDADGPPAPWWQQAAACGTGHPERRLKHHRV